MLPRYAFPALFILGTLAVPAGAQCPPAAPGGVAASNGTHCNGVLVGWDAVSGATFYEVWRSTSSGGTGTRIAEVPVPATHFTDLTALPGNTQHYWYRVRAIRTLCLPPNGVGPFGGPNEGWRGDTPTPTNVEASDGTVCVGVYVTWDEVQVPGSPVYQVFRNETNHYPSSYLVGTTTLTNLTDLTAVLGTTHYYWVRADALCGSSSASEPDAGYRGTTPGVPTNLAATHGECFPAGIRLTWDPLSGAITKIYRNTVPVLASASQVGATPLSHWVDVTGTLQQEYYYWAQRESPCGVSEYAGPVTGLEGFVHPPPELVDAEYGPTCNSVSLDWEHTSLAAPPPAAWRVYRSEVDEFLQAEHIGTTEEMEFLDEGRTPGRTYFYWIQALNGCGLGGPSGSVEFTISTDPFVISEQPESQSAAPGAGVFFSVETTGPGLHTYRWFRDGAPLQNGAGYHQVTTSPLYIHPVSTAHAGAYTVEVSNGCVTVVSEPAILTVGTPCYPDCDDSGGLNVNDYICFQTRFALGHPYADCDQNAQNNVNDYICFQTKFALGCP